MDRRPISVTLVGWLFISAGVVGLAYHAPEFDLRHPFEFDLVLGAAIRLFAIAGGVFVLDARERGGELLHRGDELVGDFLLGGLAAAAGQQEGKACERHGENAHWSSFG